MTEERARMSSVLGATGLVLGNVQGQGDFEVRGRVQGDIVLDGRVLVSGGGLVLGTIEALQITVSGTVRGDLIAEDGVEITGSGQVEGNVTSPRVAIESGAKVRGHLRNGDEPPVALRGGTELLAFGQRLVADDEPLLEALPVVPKHVAVSMTDVPELRGPSGNGFGGNGPSGNAPGGKKRRRRRRGGDRTGAGEISGPPLDTAGPSTTPEGDGRQEILPPPRPTRPSGPMPKAEAASKRPPPSDETPPRGKRSKLPTFVKGARGHLRG